MNFIKANFKAKHLDYKYLGIYCLFHLLTFIDFYKDFSNRRSFTGPGFLQSSPVSILFSLTWICFYSLTIEKCPIMAIKKCLVVTQICPTVTQNCPTVNQKCHMVTQKCHMAIHRKCLMTIRDYLKTTIQNLRWIARAEEGLGFEPPQVGPKSKSGQNCLQLKHMKRKWISGVKFYK